MVKENEKIKFSIIMPVYGVEKFINKSIQSILAQTYENYELILVNDCTKDNSGIICKNYAEKYDNIIYLEHNENKGLSESRNTGLEKATGEYVLFLDSDDYFENNMLESIEKSLQINRADVVVFGLIEEYMDQNNEHIKMTIQHFLKTQYFNNIELRKSIINLEQETLYGYAWNKAYNLQYLNNKKLKFTNVKHIEDIEFNVRFFENISSLNILEDRLYHYVQHGGQRLTNKKIDNYFDLQKQRIEIIMKQQKRWGLYEITKVKETLSLIYFRSFFSAIERCFVDCDNIQIKEKLKKEYNSSLYNELREYCKPKQIVSKILYFPCKHKNFTVTIFYAKIIHIVKSKFQFLFSRLKQTRK